MKFGGGEFWMVWIESHDLESYFHMKAPNHIWIL